MESLADPDTGARCCRAMPPVHEGVRDANSEHHVAAMPSLIESPALGRNENRR
jgi:hypothetical protein